MKFTKEKIYFLIIAIGFITLSIIGINMVKNHKETNEKPLEVTVIYIDQAPRGIYTAPNYGFDSDFEKVLYEEETPQILEEPVVTEAPATEAPATAMPTKAPETEWHKAVVTCYSNTEDNVLVGTRDNRLIDGYSCASFLDDKIYKNYLPYGTIIEIKGYGRWEVCDTAGTKTLTKRANQIKADGEIDQWFDLFFENMPLNEVDAFGEKVLEYRVIK